MLLLNAHGGNSALMTIVATELRCRFNMLCVATSWTRFGAPADVVGGDEKAIGIHGGDIETSVMLYLAPETVELDKASDFQSSQKNLTEKFRYLRAYGPHAFGWKMQDLNPVGVVGNAGKATVEKGASLIGESVQEILELLDEMDNFEMKMLKSKPE